MRLWSLHPQYLDRQGLLAGWREALLAQKVLQGETQGYRKHPQLMRFQTSPDPLAAIAAYLESIASEGQQRGYHFDRNKIRGEPMTGKLSVTRGQILYEWQHLKTKLARHDSLRLEQVTTVEFPEVHPFFEVVAGEVEAWEKTDGRRIRLSISN